MRRQRASTQHYCSVGVCELRLALRLVGMADLDIGAKSFQDAVREAKELERKTIAITASRLPGSLNLDDSNAIFPKEFESYTFAYALGEAQRAGRNAAAAGYAAQPSPGMPQAAPSPPSSIGQTKVESELQSFAAGTKANASRQESPPPAMPPKAPEVPSIRAGRAPQKDAKTAPEAYEPPEGHYGEIEHRENNDDEPYEVKVAESEGTANMYPEDLEIPAPVASEEGETGNTDAESNASPDLGKAPPSESQGDLGPSPDSKQVWEEGGLEGPKPKISSRLQAIIEAKLKKEEQEKAGTQEDIEKPVAREAKKDLPQEEVVLSSRERVIRKLRSQGIVVPTLADQIAEKAKLAKIQQEKPAEEVPLDPEPGEKNLEVEEKPPAILEEAGEIPAPPARISPVEVSPIAAGEPKPLTQEPKMAPSSSAMPIPKGGLMIKPIFASEEKEDRGGEESLEKGAGLDQSRLSRIQRIIDELSEKPKAARERAVLEQKAKVSPVARALVQEQETGQKEPGAEIPSGSKALPPRQKTVRKKSEAQAPILEKATRKKAGKEPAPPKESAQPRMGAQPEQARLPLKQQSPIRKTLPLRVPQKKALAEPEEEAPIRQTQRKPPARYDEAGQEGEAEEAPIRQTQRKPLPQYEEEAPIRQTQRKPPARYDEAGQEGEAEEAPIRQTQRKPPARYDEAGQEGEAEEVPSRAVSQSPAGSPRRILPGAGLLRQPAVQRTYVPPVRTMQRKPPQYEEAGQEGEAEEAPIRQTQRKPLPQYEEEAPVRQTQRKPLPQYEEEEAPLIRKTLPLRVPQKRAPAEQEEEAPPARIPQRKPTAQYEEAEPEELPPQAAPTEQEPRFAKPKSRDVAGEAKLPDEEEDIAPPPPPPEEEELPAPKPEDYEQAKDELRAREREEEKKKKGAEASDEMLEAYAKEKAVWLYEIYKMGGMAREDFLQKVRDRISEEQGDSAKQGEEAPNPAFASINREIGKGEKK